MIIELSHIHPASVHMHMRSSKPTVAHSDVPPERISARHLGKTLKLSPKLPNHLRQTFLHLLKPLERLNIFPVLIDSLENQQGNKKKHPFQQMEDDSNTRRTGNPPSGSVQIYVAHLQRSSYQESARRLDHSSIRSSDGFPENLGTPPTKLGLLESP